MTYHVYQPTIEGEKRWGYYCRIDGRKKTVIKYPRTRKPFASQEDVESWIAELREGEDRRPSQSQGRRRAPLRRRGRVGNPSGPTSGGPASGAEHPLRARYDRPQAHHTAARRGGHRGREIRHIEDFLYSLELSNKTRAQHGHHPAGGAQAGTAQRIIRSVPPIEMPQKKSRKPNILSLEDLRKLFPGDRAALREVWAPGKTGWGEPAEARLAIAACATTMFFGGMRPQEARAVSL